MRLEPVERPVLEVSGQVDAQDAFVRLEGGALAALGLEVRDQPCPGFVDGETVTRSDCRRLGVHESAEFAFGLDARESCRRAGLADGADDAGDLPVADAPAAEPLAPPDGQ